MLLQRRIRAALQWFLPMRSIGSRTLKRCNGKIALPNVCQRASGRTSRVSNGSAFYFS